MNEIEQLWHILHVKEVWEDDQCGAYDFIHIGGVKVEIVQNGRVYGWSVRTADGSAINSQNTFSSVAETKDDLKVALQARYDAASKKETNSDWDELWHD